MGFVSDILGSDVGQFAGGGLGVGFNQLGFFDEGGILGDPSQAGSRAAAAQQAGKEQAIQTVREQLGPFAEAGLEQLPVLQEAATAEGLGSRLEEIFGGSAFQGLIDERTRGIQGQLAAGGLTRSGAGIQAAANVPTNLGFEIEQLLAGRQGGLFQSGLGAAQGIATGVGNLQAGIGADIGSGIVTDAQAKAAQQQQLLQTGATVASFFSDPTLKENAEVIGEVGGLKIYQWDWIPQTVGTIIDKFPTIGFMANEVQEKFPEFVKTFLGFDVVDYHGLLNKLETA